MKYTGTLAALLLVSTLSAAPLVAVAQEPAAPSPAATPPPLKTGEQIAARAELERKALALLEEVVGETPSLKLIENRIRLQAAAAEMLWSHRQERAREIFNAATADLSAATAGIVPDDPQYHELASTISQLRWRMLSILAERDPKLALDFLRATRPPAAPPAQPGANQRQPDQEVLFETQLAQQIAERDPQQALRIAEETLSRGLSSNLVPLLDQLRTRDPEGAARLAANIARKLRTANFAVDYEATVIASNLLLSSRPAESASAGAAQTPANLAAQANARRLQLDEAARRDLANLLIAAAVSTGGNPRQSGNAGALLFTMRQLMPEVERYAPAQAANLRRHVEGYERSVDGRPREQRQLLETGTADAILEAAGKAAPETRQQLYHAAAWKIFNEGNADRARQIINQNIEGAGLREQLLKELDQQMSWRAASEGKVEQAQAFLARVKSPDERIRMLLQLARVTSGKGNKAATGVFLDEAWSLLGGRAKGHKQFVMQLQLAQTYAPIAPARAFEIMEVNVAQLNELVAAAAALEGFGQEGFAEGELKGQDGHLWGALGAQSNEALAALAPIDFDRALAVADRLLRAELRLNARLAVARGILFKESTRNNRNTRPIEVRFAAPRIHPIIQD
ncbi:MAG TPA: hypothetical protein VEY11_00180 [Pyrinomonadaceae bacterium]|nr:hypothetical protein [Pyrinomonadaceae bacterium]